MKSIRLATISASLFLAMQAPLAHAITITIDSVELLPNNTATQTTPGLMNRYSTFDSAINITDSGETKTDYLGSTVSASTKYTFSQTATNGDPRGTNYFDTTSSYRISFTVSTTFQSEIYDLNIKSIRNVLSYNRYDGTAFEYDSIPILRSPSLSLETSLGGDSADHSSFINYLEDLYSFGGGAKISGITGTHQFTLDYTWRNGTYSRESNNVSAAVMLGGMDPQLNPILAEIDSYSGLDGLYPGYHIDPSDYGQFVDISAKVTFVPEVSAMILSMIILPLFAFTIVRVKARGAH